MRACRSLIELPEGNSSREVVEIIFCSSFRGSLGLERKEKLKVVEGGGDELIEGIEEWKVVEEEWGVKSKMDAGYGPLYRRRIAAAVQRSLSHVGVPIHPHLNLNGTCHDKKIEWTFENA
ncbi:hypothetical protein QJS10_CPA06g01990 [Acorus calamus]|uniref:Uncharacterized protein n=1 Tax=Acorus calamus TaxID=4465 RepID=A0AAV9EQ92_ACOCL|nr:hypothetical protein QJS10_CPA06g01990 [Acorus calamus]